MVMVPGELSKKLKVLIGYVKSKLLGNGQIISIVVLVIVMIIAVFQRMARSNCERGSQEVYS